MNERPLAEQPCLHCGAPSETSEWVETGESGHPFLHLPVCYGCHNMFLRLTTWKAQERFLRYLVEKVHKRGEATTWTQKS